MSWCRDVCVVLSLLTFTIEAAIFYPPFPPPGQYHEPPPTLPVPPKPPVGHITQLIGPPHHAFNQQGHLLSVIRLYLNQLRLPQYVSQPQSGRSPHLADLATELPETGEPANEGPIGQLALGAPNVPREPSPGEQAHPATIPPTQSGGFSPMGNIGGLYVGAVPTPVPWNLQPQPPVRGPTIYNLQNNVPNNPLPIGQIRAQFYERLCYQTQATIMPIVRHYYPGFQQPLIGADIPDPPACSCIPFNDCESAAHRFINERTKDECGSTLTGFACCCEEPPIIGK